MSWSADRKGRHIGAVLAALVLLAMLMPATRALSQDNRPSQDDVLQQAINYVFSGKVDPQNAPEIADRASCIVVIPDAPNKRFIRYYLGRFKIDPPQFETTYSGRTPIYTLVVEGDDDVIEFLNRDMTLSHGHRTARIALTGDLDQTQRALRVISDQCKAKRPKTLF